MESERESKTKCECYTSRNLNTGKDEPTISRTCPVHTKEAADFYAQYDAKCARAAERTKTSREAVDVERLNDKAREAASEICEVFDVRQPRGVRYYNTNHETIAIIIAQNMKGVYPPRSSSQAEAKLHAVRETLSELEPATIETDDGDFEHYGLDATDKWLDKLREIVK